MEIGITLKLVTLTLVSIQPYVLWLLFFLFQNDLYLINMCLSLCTLHACFHAVHLSLLPECCATNDFAAMFSFATHSPSTSWIQGPCCVHHAGEESIRAHEQSDVQKVERHEGQAGGGHPGEHRCQAGDGATQPWAARWAHNTLCAGGAGGTYAKGLCAFHNFVL